MSASVQSLVLPDDEHNRMLVANVHPPDWLNPEPAGRYNMVVVGAGTAGLITAVVAAGLGAKVALIERHLMGGDCLNVGCVPSKALIRSAKLLHQARLGHVSEDLVSSLASRLTRLDGRIAADDRERLEEIAGSSLSDLAHQMVDAIDPDRQLAQVQMDSGAAAPDEAAVEATKKKMFEQALLPIASNPELCDELENVQRSVEQMIDEISQDTITRADFVVDAESRAQQTVESFRQYLEDNQDEIAGFQVYFSKPYAQRPTYADIKALADAISKPPHSWTAEKLWDAYETLDDSKVRGSAGTVLTNLVSLVRFALGVDDQLEPWPQRVQERFDAWMLQQLQDGRTFTEGQTEWLGLIRDHLAASLSIDLVELQDPPFSQHGGLFKARELFGNDLDSILVDLTKALAA